MTVAELIALPADARVQLALMLQENLGELRAIEARATAAREECEAELALLARITREES